jgi:hypothetical protein
MKVQRRSVADSGKMRQVIMTALALAIAAIAVLINLFPDEVMLNSSVSVTATAGIAMVISIVIAFKQKMDGLYGKINAALAIGLVCWFAGEVIWTYDNIIIGREPAELSLADAPWLALYGFFGYYIFKSYRFFGNTVNKYHAIVVIGGVAALMANTIFTVYSTLESVQTLSPLTVAIRLAYPVGDAILIAPSLLLLITLRHGLLTYTPWLLISIALILIAAGDVLFSNISLLAEFDLSTIAFPLYNAGNLCFVGALVWYNMFGVYDRSRALKSYQERNR